MASGAFPAIYPDCLCAHIPWSHMKAKKSCKYVNPMSHRKPNGKCNHILMSCYY